MNTEQGFKLAVYGTFTGVIFGGISWLLILAGLAKDWMTMGAIAILVLLLYMVCIRICLRHPQYLFRLTIMAIIWIGLTSMVVMNLRWPFWVKVFTQETTYSVMGGYTIEAMRQYNLMMAGVTVLLVVILGFWEFLRYKGRITIGPDTHS